MSESGKSDREQDKFLPGRTSSTVRSDFIKCPYFRAHGACQIRCKGISDETRIALRFLNTPALRLHEKVFCSSYEYWRCEICRMLDQIDEEDQ